MQKSESASGIDVATTTVIVARGRSIQVGLRTFGPGEQAIVSIADADFFRTHGFIVDPDGSEPPVIRSVPEDASKNPYGIGLQTKFER